MNSIRMNKNDLIKILESNRQSHIQEYNEAMDNWYQEYQRLLTEEMGKDKSDSDGYVQLTKPESHEKDYDRTISMLNHSIDNEVEISQNEYKMYVLDEWSWMERFKHLNSTYIK